MELTAHVDRVPHNIQPTASAGRPDSAWNGRLPDSRIFVDHSR